MNLSDDRYSSFILRMLALVAFSLMVTFAAIVVLSNDALKELFPGSASRSLAIMFGYIVAIITFNYALAIKGNNLMPWKVELSMVVGVLAVFVAVFLPFAFSRYVVVESEGIFSFLRKGGEYAEPNWYYSIMGLLSFPFFYQVFLGLKRADR